MSENIIEPVIENFVTHKVAVASKDYPDYEIEQGDALAFGLYMAQYDIEPFAWNSQIANNPVLRAIEHEWVTLESGQNLPQLKNAKLP